MTKAEIVSEISRTTGLEKGADWILWRNLWR